MEEQMAADASLSYLTDEFTAIDPEQSFYWNADGDLVLVFDEYAVAAGYMAWWSSPSLRMCTAPC